MSSIDKPGGRSYSLKVTIASLFIGLILVLGITLGWYNYHKTSALLFEASNEVFGRMGTEVTNSFNGTAKSVSQAVHLLAHSQVAHSRSLEDRIQTVDLFIVALEQEPQLSGLQAGFADGGYFIVRPLDSDFVRQKFGGPDQARYVVDNIEEAQDGARLLSRLWLDQQGEVLSRAEPEPTEFDPRVRPWFTSAVEGKQFVTDPYLFFFMKKVGVTLSYMPAGGGVVVAGDVTLSELSEVLSGYEVSPRSELFLLSASGKVLASDDPEEILRRDEENNIDIADIDDLTGAIGTFGRRFELGKGVYHFSYDKEDWIAQARKLDLNRKDSGTLVMATPKREFLDEAISNQVRAAYISLVIIVLSALLSWAIARWIARPLSGLAVLAEKISRFDFKDEQRPGSFIQEVDTLSSGMSRMQSTISRFLSLISSLAGEQDFDVLMKRICEETTRVSDASGAFIHLVNDQDGSLHPAAYHAEGSMSRQELAPDGWCEDHRLVELMNSGRTATIDVETDKANTLVVLPLHNRQKSAIGTLCLVFPPEFAKEGNQRERLAFLEALSGFAAVTLESRHLLKMQKELLDSFIRLMAGAIDAKSPYTGGHCQRVPIITKMLAEQACGSSEPPFADFSLSSDQWEALDIASWLHDCGKVTTPEFVVDKSTKLETLYDRIHEVRMRFEVLKRDVRIEYWEKVAAGENEEEQAKILSNQVKQLDEEFEFVAVCNEGGEFLDPEKVARLRQIAERTWTRTLDDRIGISWEEKQRKDSVGEVTLPREEHLLADRQDHLIKRSGKDRLGEDNPYGFKIETPEYVNNRGELYNLSVSRGTLNSEERYLINDHIVQTIIMLQQLPFPSYLKSVPEIAGGHHEKTDGTGYPRKLVGEQLSLPARMMAIADVFEALTASDRPYKKAKTLSEAVKVMGFMVEDKHLDRDLFALFLSSGVHERYARENLLPEQVDEVDVSAYLNMV